MPSKKQYDLVQNDDYDTRIPLHPEEAFHHGITFQAKYIGMLDVPRPTSRVEIVAAMRRIRYEFKSKGIKKKKVTVEVSIDGVKVTLRKKKKRKHWMDDKSVLLNHPIYRIFYVSHDSQDLKIFSYIARDGASNVFKCAVFKSNKKSQAMRVVRTIGQAFEVCHRLQIEAPPEPAAADADLDDGATCTQDLLSDRLSDAPSDRPADRSRHRDLISDAASDKASLPPDDSSLKDSYLESNSKNSRNKHPELEILPPPPNNKKSALTSAETYAAPHSDGLASSGGGGGSGGSISSLPPVGGALSAHHELQLLREQLAQQSQQTREALAQLQLAREQLAAEQSARLEAQARTHQLLVHNRELLDHIAALVAHLQGDKSGQHQTPPHMAMPQQPQHSPGGEGGYMPQDQAEATHLELNAAFQALGLNHHALIENRSATSCLPTSPLRSSFNPSGGIFNFSFPPVDTPSFEAQWLQRLQALGGYSPTFPIGFPQALPMVPQMYGQGLLNNNYALQMQQQKKMPQSGIATLPRYTGESRFGARSSEPRQMPSNQYQSQQNLYQPQNTQQPQFSQTLNKPPQTNYSHTNHNQNLHVHQEMHQHRETSPQTQTSSHSSSDKSEAFIKPLAQMGTLTTTDSEGRVRVIVPVPADSSESTSNTLFSNLRIGEDGRLYSGPMGPITRTASEKVPNRSELMDQLRSTWSRHTTK